MGALLFATDAEHLLLAAIVVAATADVGLLLLLLLRLLRLLLISIAGIAIDLAIVAVPVESMVKEIRIRMFKN